MSPLTKKILRDYYSIDEAASLANLKLDDFLYLAAAGKFDLYVLADAWKPSRIYQFKQPKSKPDGPENTAKNRSLLNRAFSMEEDSRNWWIGLSKQCNGVPARGFSHVEKEGPLGCLYILKLSGAKPIARHSIAQYRTNPSSAILEIDLNRTLALDDEPAETYFTPDPIVLVADAIRENKLVVMSQDIEALNHAGAVQDTNISVATQSDASNNKVTNTPKIKDNTQEKYDLWQAEAEKLKALHPGWSKSEVARKLAGPSSPIPIDFRKTAATIRKHIKL